MKRASLLIALSIFVARTSAAEGSGGTTITDALPPGAEPARKVGYWASGETRAFVSGILDFGYLYLRPRLSAGFGKPHYRWVGVDVNAIVNDNGYGAYGGIRGAMPLFDIRFGARPFASFRHTPLQPRGSYDVLDLNTKIGTPTRVVTFEGELSGSLPLGPGSILTVLGGSHVVGAPDGAYIYEETLHVIVAPPWIWRTRLGYALKLGAEGNASAGLVAEMLYLPGRHDYVIRAGFIGTFVISDHLEALISLVPPIKSPDSLGAAGGDFGQLGIRYRFATGEPSTPSPL
ncbi:MAG: hypothetical protein ABI175_25260 [Polyangiales bacterium]